MAAQEERSADTVARRQELDHQLAADRTDLSNERTLLAYVQTGLALLGVGATFIKFFEELGYAVIGWILFPAGVATSIIGFVRFRKLRGRIRKIRAHSKLRDVDSDD